MASIRNWSVSVPSKHDLYEETADTTVKPEGWVLEPDSAFLLWWQVAKLFLCVYYIASILFRLAFNDDSIGFLFFFDFFVDLFFVFDVCVSLHSGYYENGKKIMNLTAIKANYFKFWFYMDILCCLPLDLFQLVQMEVNFVFRVLKLLRIVPAVSIVDFIEGKPGINVNLVRIGRMVMYAFILFHCVACGWFSFSGFDGFDPFGYLSWLPQEKLMNSSKYSQYLHSLFFALNAVAEMGETGLPSTNAQLIFALVCTFVGVFSFAFVVGSFDGIVNSINVHRHEYQSKMSYVSTFLANQRLPVDIVTRVEDYYNYVWSTNHGRETSNILSALPDMVRAEVSIALTQDIVNKVPFFQNAEPGFIESVIMLLQKYCRPHTAVPGEYIIRMGEVGHDMFFLQSGELEVLVTESEERISLLRSGDAFGEFALLFDAKRSASIRALTFSEVFSLSRKDLLKVMELYPSQAGVFLKESKRQMKLVAARERNLAMMKGLDTHDTPKYEGSVLDGFVRSKDKRKSYSAVHTDNSSTSLDPTENTDYTENNDVRPKEYDNFSDSFGKIKSTDQNSSRSAESDQKDLIQKNSILTSNAIKELIHPDVQSPFTPMNSEQAESSAAAHVSKFTLKRIPSITATENLEVSYTPTAATAAVHISKRRQSDLHIDTTGESLLQADSKSPASKYLQSNAATTFKKNLNETPSHVGFNVDSPSDRVLTNSVKSSTRTKKSGTTASANNKLAKFFVTTENENSEQKKEAKGIHPDHPYLTVWNIAVLIVVAYNFYLVPFRAAFLHTDVIIPFFVIDSVGDIMLVIDLFIQARVGIIVRGVLVDDLEVLRAKYFRSTKFYLDLIGSFPLLDLVQIYTGVLPSIRFLRLARGFSLFLESNDKQLRSNPHLFDLLTLIFIIFTSAHLTACGYFSFTIYEGYFDPSTPNVYPWLPNIKYASDSLFSQYIRALFFATSHLTGLGRIIHPNTDRETLFSLCVMIFGKFCIAYLVGNVASIMGDIGLLKARFASVVYQANEFLNDRGISDSIKARVNRHFEHAWSVQKGIDPNVALNYLPSELRSVVTQFTAGHMLRRLEMFKNCRESLISALVAELVYESFPAGEYLFLRGQIGSKMYFVCDGRVDIHMHDHPIPENAKPIQMVEKGFFGESALFNGKRSATAIAFTSVDALVLSSESFEYVMQIYPDFALQMIEVAERHAEVIRKLAEKDGHNKTTSVAEAQLRKWKAKMTIKLEKHLHGDGTSMAGSAISDDFSHFQAKSVRHSVLSEPSVTTDKKGKRTSQLN